MSSKPGAGLCWRTIGTAGDATCPRLRELVNCPNCEAFAAAGRSLLDREMPEAQGAAAVTQAGPRAEESPLETVSVVVFRLGQEWFALPTSRLVKIVPARQPHRIPSRRSAVLTGLVNVDGELVLCASLAAMLGIRAVDATSQGPAKPRVLVLLGQGQQWACPVDEVAGVHRVAAARPDPLPVTLAKAAISHSVGLLAVDDRRVALLDPEAVLSSLADSVSGCIQ